VIAPAAEAALAERLAQAHTSAFRIDRQQPEPYESVIASVPGLTTVYFVADGSDGAAAAGGTDDLLAFLRVVQALRRPATLEGLRELVLVTRGAQAVETEAPQPAPAALIGLAKSAALETPGLNVVCLDLDPAGGDEAGPDVVRAHGDLGARAERAIRRGRLYHREVVELQLPPADPADVPLRQGGVYLIAGGAHGIGLELARDLARTKQAKLALVGRRPLDAERRRALEELRALGGDARYWAADVTDRTGMQRVVAEVRSSWGDLAGVVHSALVLRDTPIEDLDEAGLRAAYDPKATGSVVLHEVTKDRPLDFLLFFSSGNTFTGAAGQANYVAGCAFQDAFALRLRREGRPAQVVNWGFWGEVGAVATAEHRARMARQGIGSIGITEGLAAVRSLLAHDVDQALVIRLDGDARRRLGVTLHEVTRAAAVHSPRAAEHAEAAGRAVASTGAGGLLPAELHAALLALARTRLIETLAASGAEPRAGAETSVAELERRAGVGPRHRRLFSALLRSLERGGFAARSGDRVAWSALAEAASVAALRADAQERIDPLVADHPGLAGHVALLGRCLDHLPAVLAGETAGTDVLFPDSSLAWVEPIYQGHPSAERLNRTAAEAVRAAAGAMLDVIGGARPLQVLEVGAGTGGTSRAVLEALAPFGERVRYLYTDVSPRFVQHGRRAFGDRASREFRVLDVEGDVGGQGFGEASGDLVLAANVLHATRDIGRTLNEVKKLLRRHGLLVVLEGTAVDDFMTYTFGLLDGWWRAEDPERRLADSPLLDVEGWRRVMAAAGFGRVAAVEPRAGEAVLIAESDGRAVYAVGAPSAPATRVAVVTVEPRVKTAAPAAAAPARETLRAFVERRIGEQVVGAFGLEPADLDRDKRFSEFGADSIVSVELVNRINEALGLKLKPPVLFDYPSIRELAGHLVQAFGSGIAAAFGLAAPAEVPVGNGHAAPSLVEDVLSRLEAGAITYEEALRLVPDESALLNG
jgi:NAD(P)-dependent dehydrogenase (short-subunit alcohol dehydrogenase family)/SAM-dependent methyltransferase/acyl carrier protein